MANLPKLLGPKGAPALTKPARALLVAAATDASCGVQPTAEDCAAAADANNCMWFDAEVRDRAAGAVPRAGVRRRLGRLLAGG